MVDQAFVLTVVGTGMGILIGMGGLVLTLHIHVSSEIRAIKEEMKDFHGRLEKQDAEFKAFMRQQEEKRTQILMRQG